MDYGLLGKMPGCCVFYFPGSTVSVNSRLYLCQRLEKNVFMGKVFAIRCPECGHEFLQFNGVGMRGFAAGERKKDTDKFSCPQ